MPLYELAILGAPSNFQAHELKAELAQIVAQFALTLGKEISWSVKPASFDPSPRHASAAIFVGAISTSDDGLVDLLRRGVPIIPVASRPERFIAEIPAVLRRLSGLTFQGDGSRRIVTGLLECAGLLPRQRRVFVSYRRQESREVALQLFDALSARLFDVFLDTHGIPPAEDFQAMLWHRLCDSDVLVMIDTPGYFESRWTSAEFGRALSKNIAVLRVGWPGCKPSPRAVTSGTIELAAADLDATSGRISSPAIDRICHETEALRSESIAVRHLNLVSGIEQGLKSIGGSIEGVGLHKGIHIRLLDGTLLVAYPITGSPTSVTLQEAADHSPTSPPAVVYDHVGLHLNHLGHLDWLGSHIPTVRLVKACESAWRFAGWGV